MNFNGENYGFIKMVVEVTAYILSLLPSMSTSSLANIGSLESMCALIMKIPLIPIAFILSTKYLGR